MSSEDSRPREERDSEGSAEDRPRDAPASGEGGRAEGGESADPPQEPQERKPADDAAEETSLPEEEKAAAGEETGASETGETPPAGEAPERRDEAETGAEQGVSASGEQPATGEAEEGSRQDEQAGEQKEQEQEAAGESRGEAEQAAGGPAESEGLREEPADEDGGGRESGAPSESESPPEQRREERERSSAETFYDDPYTDEYGEPYPEEPERESTAVARTEPGRQGPAPPGGGDGGGFDGEGDDEEGMVRMTFLEHLEELRKRILHSLAGLVVAYLACLALAPELYDLVAGPAKRALANLPFDPPLQLVAITPQEQFFLIYIKIPLLGAVFLASPWLMYQAWGFISPGLYRREKRWAVPFIFTTAGLFILGGVFGYFVVLRFALTFLLGIGQEMDVRPMITISSYFDMFMIMELGLGIVFQLPVMIFFLTLLRILRPGFLLTNVRYAILIMFIAAAVITPTPDVFNMTLFAAPMILLFFVGIGASYLLVWKREGRRIPWLWIGLGSLLVLILVLAGLMYFLHAQFGYEFVLGPPWVIEP